MATARGIKTAAKVVGEGEPCLTVAEAEVSTVRSISLFMVRDAFPDYRFLQKSRFDWKVT